MLIALTYDLGDYGPKKDGIDGIFGGKTFDAVKAFQEDKYYKDWEGESLNEDEFVGPRTSDALNRALVGIWYDFYQTDPKLTDEKLIVTVTPKFLTNGSLYLENIEQYKEVKIIVKTFPRDTVSEEEPRWKRLQREADAQWKYLEEVEKEAEEKEEEEERRKQYEGR
jgi:HD superfamily phosphohydrolase